MAVKAQPGAREAIQHLSSILTDCSIPKVPSESFRQAKFNRDEATGVLWTLLLNTVQLLLFLESRTTTRTHENSVEYHSLLPTSSDNTHSQIATLVIRKYLLSLGYSRVEFYCVPLNSGSRELLMAFGWLLHKTRLIEKLHEYHLEMASEIQVPFKANKMFAIRGMVDEAESVEGERREILNNLSQVALGQKTAMSKHLSDDTSAMAKVDEGLKKLAWMKGRLQAKWKSALSSRMAYLKLAHRLHKSTLTQQQSHNSDKPSSHMSVHELFLLRYREQMSSYLRQVELHMSCLQRIIQWQVYEPVFWQWMESVLDLDEREKAALLVEQKEKEETADSAKVGNSHTCNGVVKDQLESVERLKDKVQLLDREVHGLLEKHKPYLEKIKRVWQLKVKTVHHGELERKHTQNVMKIESLLLKTNQQLQLKLGRVKEATSSVETLTMLDRTTYVMKDVETQRRKSALPRIAVEHQQRPNAELLHESRHFYRQILSELERKQALIQHHKENIHRQLLLREKTLSMSVCKIEK